jgi:hypothetical protein
MVQDPEERQGYDKEWLQKNYPRTYGYLKRFEEVLRERRSRGISDMLKEGAPFYTMFAVGTYTFAPWKVVWRYIASDFIVAVARPRDGKLVVPDHRLMLVDCLDENEAHYLCATLNSSPIRLAVRGFFVETQIAPHVVERLRIPRFDPNNPVHLRLAELSEQAHGAAKVGDENRLREIEAEIDRWAARLWGLSDDELREIQRSFRELAGEEEPQAEEQP